MIAKDFRRLAWQALSGNWPQAILLTLVAALLGAEVSGGANFNSSQDNNSSFGANNVGGVQMPWLVAQMLQQIPGLKYFLVLYAPWMFAAAMLYALVALIVGSVANIGLARYHTLLVLREEQQPFATLFSPCRYWGRALTLRILTWVKVFLWRLLFVIPGFIASYRYAMAPYILAADPELSAGEALDYSKEMMDGNKWRLFCLHFSFIGWQLLAGLTLGVLSLMVNPYYAAAEAAFYLELSGQLNFRDDSGAVIDV